MIFVYYLNPFNTFYVSNFSNTFKALNTFYSFFLLLFFQETFAYYFKTFQTVFTFFKSWKF